MVYAKGEVESCAVNMPWMGDFEDEFLKDIALVTGATYVESLDEFDLSKGGSARKVLISEGST
jgi:hypothetical protein